MIIIKILLASESSSSKIRTSSTNPTIEWAIRFNHQILLTTISLKGKGSLIQIVILIQLSSSQINASLQKLWTMRTNLKTITVALYNNPAFWISLLWKQEWTKRSYILLAINSNIILRSTCWEWSKQGLIRSASK